MSVAYKFWKCKAGAALQMFMQIFTSGRQAAARGIPGAAARGFVKLVAVRYA
jgi:hypothetical protein